MKAELFTLIMNILKTPGTDQDTIYQSVVDAIQPIKKMVLPTNQQLVDFLTNLEGSLRNILAKGGLEHSIRVHIMRNSLPVLSSLIAKSPFKRTTSTSGEAASASQSCSFTNYAPYRVVSPYADLTGPFRPVTDERLSFGSM